MELGADSMYSEVRFSNFEDFLVKQPSASAWLSCIPAFLRFPNVVGAGKLHKEANTGKGMKIRKWMRGYITYILPLIILFIFFFGLYDKFFA